MLEIRGTIQLSSSNTLRCSNESPVLGIEDYETVEASQPVSRVGLDNALCGAALTLATNRIPTVIDCW